jgi:hypothetical protein
MCDGRLHICKFAKALVFQWLARIDVAVTSSAQQTPWMQWRLICGQI